MLKRTEILDRFQYNLEQDKNSFVASAQKEEMVDLCSAVLDSFDNNMMGIEQFEAGIEFAKAVRDHFAFGKQVEELKLSLGKSPLERYESAGKLKPKGKAKLLWSMQYLTIMASYSQAIADQPVIPGDKSAQVLEQGLKYADTVNNILQMA